MSLLKSVGSSVVQDSVSCRNCVFSLHSLIYRRDLSSDVVTFIKVYIIICLSMMLVGFHFVNSINVYFYHFCGRVL